MVPETHLVVFVHGVMGYIRNMSYVATELEKKHGDKVTVLMSAVNQGPLMYDGLDVCGTRLAQEIVDTCKALENDHSCHVTRFSIVSYSMGGLVSRFAVGLLDRLGLFEGVELMNYVTFATPHLGVYRPVNSIFARFHNATLRYSWSPIGHQMEYVEKSLTYGKPIMQVLADPDYEFYRALSKFRTRQLYANAVGDISVPYFSGAIEECDYFERFPDMTISYDNTYSTLIAAFDVRSDEHEKEKGSREPLYSALLMLILYPFMVTWGIHATRRAEAARLQCCDQEGHWTIQEHSTKHRLPKEEPANESTVSEEASTRKDSPSAINPEPGRNLIAQTKPLPLHPIQKYGYMKLNKLVWKKVIVRLDHWAHVFIVVTDPSKVNPGGKIVIRHFVDTFVL